MATAMPTVTLVGRPLELWVCGVGAVALVGRAELPVLLGDRVVSITISPPPV